MRSYRDLSLERLGKAVGVTAQDARTFIAYYNNDYSAYGNEIYERIETRLAHWQNQVIGEWFSKRIDLGLDLIESSFKGPTVFVDVGFSVAYPYFRKSLITRRNLRCLFVDKQQSAIEFFNRTRSLLGKEIVGRPDRALRASIEQESDRELIVKAIISAQEEFRREADILVMGSEVVEHLEHPETFWKLLRQLSLIVEKSVHVYVTLPVGKKIPSHTLEFADVKKTLQYLLKYMSIDSFQVLHPPEGHHTSPYLQACVCAYGCVECGYDSKRQVSGSVE